MGMNLDSNTINKGMDIVKNFSQMGANLTKDHKPQQPQPPKPDNFNQPHTQTVEVKVGDPSQAPKPVIIEKKPEIREYKVFPDGRELSERECTVREMEIKNDHEYRMRELDWKIRLEEENRKERREREERYEKERERRKERDRRMARAAGVCMVGLGVVAVGAFAYSIYTDSRHPARQRMAIPAPENVAPVQAEGTVA